MTTAHCVVAATEARLWRVISQATKAAFPTALTRRPARKSAFMAMIWLVDRAGGRILGLTLSLAFWVALTEAAQTWIVGRTADITPPLIVIATGLLFSRLKPSETRAAGVRCTPSNPNALP